MHILSIRAAFTALLLISAACAADLEPSAADEDFTAAQDPREPDRAAVLEALKSAKRTSLMPSTVAFVSPSSTHNAVILRAKFSGTLNPGDFANAEVLNQVSKDLRAKKFSIAGKYASFEQRTCAFKAKGDYLGLSTQTTLLADNMAKGNVALAPTVAYSPAQIDEAKAIDKQIRYKLTLTSQAISLYLGKSAGVWKVLAVDTSEFACVGDGP